MGKIAGVFYFDSRPISDDDETWIRGAIGAGGQPHAEVWRSPGLILGETRFANDRDAAGARIVSGERDACTWDGVLHNRRDLLNRFGDNLPPPISDNALALRLYRSRGPASLRDLIGDWSLAIWDAANQTILLASDYAGIRPLYYYRGTHSLLWSSSLLHLAQRVGFPGLDEEFVASFLKYGKAARRTPYLGIYPVPSGHAVQVSANRLSIEEFWSLPFQLEVRFNDARCYEDQLRNLFREAVSVRIAKDAPVCSELSGGMDSSSVACMASQIMAGRAKPVTFSYLFAGSTDEPYIRAVERALDNPGIHLNLDDYPFFTADRPGEAAPTLAVPRLLEVAQRMAAMGSEVFLTGQPGDFIMGATYDDSDQVTEYLERGRLIAAVGEAFAWSRSMRVPIYSILWHCLRTIWSSAPPVFDLTAVRGARNPYANVDSLAPEFRKRVSLEEIERQQRRRWQEARPSQRRRFRNLTEMLESRELQAPETMQHVSFTHPFAHRPLVEYMLAIPAAEVCRPGEPRRLMRRTFAGILPPGILRRKSKTVYGPVFRQASTPLAAEFLKQPDGIRLIELGYVDSASLTERLTRLVAGLECNEAQLRHVLLLECWLRKRIGNRRPGG